MIIYSATKNIHKLREFNEILQPHGINVIMLEHSDKIPEIPETGTSFKENAIIKATTIASIAKKTVIADDSGLEVFSLNGEPGIRSARYAGEKSSDMECIKKLLGKLEHHADRTSRFVCVIAVADPTGLIGTTEGEIRGTISETLKGKNGFGYDPIFIPEGLKQTFAQLSAEKKNRMSHRFYAIKQCVETGLL